MKDCWNLGARSGEERLDPGVDHRSDALIGQRRPKGTRRERLHAHVAIDRPGRPLIDG